MTKRYEKRYSFPFLGLLLIVSSCVSGVSRAQHLSDDRRVVWFQDNQYYRPMLADIRAPRFHMGWYRDPAIPFSNSTTDGDHNFWDVAFGTQFTVVDLPWNRRDPAFNLSSPDTQQMIESGLSFFVEGAAHMLLDFNTLSSDVINTDFRVGGGVAGRLPPPLSNVAFRGRFFHESTHIGDEFTLSAVRSPAFRRYNVSYEAVDGYVAVDRYRTPTVMGKTGLVYARGYFGARKLDSGEYSDFVQEIGENQLAPPLRTFDLNEFQLGGELFLKVYRPGDRLGPWRSATQPQFFVIAADFYRRDRYDIVSPEMVWSTNIVLGLIYGDYFGGKRNVQLNFRYYDGVNPHGQFRSMMIRYWAIDAALGF